MNLLEGISLPLGADSERLKAEILKKTGISVDRLKGYEIVKKSVDARKKPDVREIYTVALDIKGASRLPDWNPAPNRIEALPVHPKRRGDVLVVGMGPAGLFAALTLSAYGAHVTVIERGEPTEKRDEAVRKLRQDGVLNPESNVQFGEGGAGTYSDGKLNSGIKSPYSRAVLGELIAHGAPREIGYESRPHVGTDYLKTVVKRMRRTLLDRGVSVHFDSRLIDLKRLNGGVEAVWIEDGKEVRERFEAVFLAIGHSARDTFQLLERRGFPLEQKPFSVGVRIEHPQTLINRAQYGRENTPPADYRLAQQLPNGRGVYTFCMCPGGEVVAAASEEGGVVTNGMSYHARDGVNANSALLVSVTPADFESSHPLAGVDYQRRIERLAFALGGGAYRAPAQRVGDFLSGTPTAKCGAVVPSYRPGVAWGNLNDIFPNYITDGLRAGIVAFDKKLKGFALPDAVLTAPETRSSSPVRILRGENGRSPWGAVYPVGEGAGYAGGILSSAVDGVGAAIRYLESNEEER